MNRLTYIAMTGIVSIGFLGKGDRYNHTPITNQVQDTLDFAFNINRKF